MSRGPLGSSPGGRTGRIRRWKSQWTVEEAEQCGEESLEEGRERRRVRGEGGNI